MPSLRGAQRRSNPERVKVQRGLDRFVALAMTEESQQGMREREKLAMTDATFDHSGSRFDALLNEEGLLDEAEASALKRVIAGQLVEMMQAQGVYRDDMADRTGTNRAQIDRLCSMRTAGRCIGRR